MPNSEVRVVYGFCQDNCKYPVYTKEDIIALLEYVIEHNALPPDIVIDGEVNSSIQLAAVNSIIEQNKGAALRLFVGTQEEYNNYTGDKNNLFAIITDDKTKQKILDTLQQHTNSINEIITGLNDGTFVVKKAENAQNAILNSDNTYSGFTQDENNVLKTSNEIISKKIPLYGDGSYIENPTSITLNEAVNAGDVIEIEFGIGSNATANCVKSHKVHVRSSKFQLKEMDASFNSSTGTTITGWGVLIWAVDFSISDKTLEVTELNRYRRTFSNGQATEDFISSEVGNTFNYVIRNIYKIIE